MFYGKKNAVLIFCVFIGVWITLSVGATYVWPDMNTRAIIGDGFGVINSFFSAAAFGAIAVSLIFQMRDLEQNRSEITQTRELHAEMLELQKRIAISNLGIVKAELLKDIQDGSASQEQERMRIEIENMIIDLRKGERRTK